MTALPATWCSCGCSEPHAILERRTFDHVLVELTSDGAVWFGMVREPGRGMAPSRSPEAAERVKRASRVVLEWACVYTVPELQDLLTVARSMAKVPSTIAEVRAEQKRRAERLTVPKIDFVTVRTDARGRPLERHARLPRMRWPGTWIFDFCGREESARGRYRIFRELGGQRHDRRDVTVADTGFAFRNLASLWKHLWSETVEVTE